MDEIFLAQQLYTEAPLPKVMKKEPIQVATPPPTDNKSQASEVWFPIAINLPGKTDPASPATASTTDEAAKRSQMIRTFLILLAVMVLVIIALSYFKKAA